MGPVEAATTLAGAGWGKTHAGMAGQPHTPHATHQGTLGWGNAGAIAYTHATAWQCCLGITCFSCSGRRNR